MRLFGFFTIQQLFTFGSKKALVEKEECRHRGGMTELLEHPSCDLSSHIV